MKEIKDYLHLYLGCYVETDQGFGRLVSTTIDGNFIVNLESMDDGEIIGEIKPILRRLSDMTKEELWYNDELESAHTTNRIKQREYEAQRTLWLLDRRFDLFGLIESGLAIDATKQLTPTSPKQ